MDTALIKTAAGDFRARYSQAGLAALEFPGTSSSGKGSQPQLPTPLKDWHKLTAQALHAVLAGKPPVKLPPLDLSSGTDFQQQVWQALRDIPLGQARTYGQIARLIRRPAAARAVGAACGANPIPVLIPCHRVVASDGKLGGFSGGITWKQRLLAAEGFPLGNRA